MLGKGSGLVGKAAACVWVFVTFFGGRIFLASNPVETWRRVFKDDLGRMLCEVEGLGIALGSSLLVNAAAPLGC